MTARASDPMEALASLRRHHRVRALAATALATSGLIDLLFALLPPVRGRLGLLLRLVPLGVPQTADALTALAGLGLVTLAWGVRKGQHQAWAIALGILFGDAALQLVKGMAVAGSLRSVALAMYLLARQSSFTTVVDRLSRRHAIVALVFGATLATTVGAAAIESYLVFDAHRHALGWSVVLGAAATRLVGVDSVVLPEPLNDFLGPALGAIGVALGAVSLFLACRSVALRRREASPAQQRRARAVVAAHGGGTLDYFALRHDKQAFFFGDTVVSYGVYGGVCLVSPDPIGPVAERDAAFAAFRHFVDRNGWTLAVLGADAAWLERYRAAGMRALYVGDEAVVDLAGFSLAGGRRKGLRQAVHRIAAHGYTASFHDPADVDPALAAELTRLLAMSRRGRVERGFSMTLGRLFHPDDKGLLLAVARDRDGHAVAFCQFVPSPGIGGFSLDVVRRDQGEHPNGLIDFLVVQTIEHLRQAGAEAIGLNFATMRAVLAGETGDSFRERARRWLLRRMSKTMQIESLWRFTAKYDPRWLARYVVYDARYRLPAAALAIARAESVWELPVLGRFLAARDVRRERREEAA